MQITQNNKNINNLLVIFYFIDSFTEEQKNTEIF